MTMTAKRWSLSALAVEFQMDRRTVAKRLDGIPPAGERAGAPVWRLVDAAPVLAGEVAASDGTDTDIDEAKRRKAVAEARLAEMAADRAAGRLLERGDVDAAVVGAFARVRVRLLSIPAKVAPLVATIDNPAEVEALVRGAVHDALRELAETAVSDLA